MYTSQNFQQKEERKELYILKKSPNSNMRRSSKKLHKKLGPMNIIIQDDVSDKNSQKNYQVPVNINIDDQVEKLVERLQVALDKCRKKNPMQKFISEMNVGTEFWLFRQILCIFKQNSIHQELESINFWQGVQAQLTDNADKDKKFPVQYLSCDFNLFGAMTSNFRNCESNVLDHLKKIHVKIAEMYEGEVNRLCLEQLIEFILTYKHYMQYKFKGDTEPHQFDAEDLIKFVKHFIEVPGYVAPGYDESGMEVSKIIKEKSGSKADKDKITKLQNECNTLPTCTYFEIAFPALNGYKIEAGSFLHHREYTKVFNKVKHKLTKTTFWERNDPELELLLSQLTLKEKIKEKAENTEEKAEKTEEKAEEKDAKKSAKKAALLKKEKLEKKKEKLEKKKHPNYSEEICLQILRKNQDNPQYFEKYFGSNNYQKQKLFKKKNNQKNETIYKANIDKGRHLWCLCKKARPNFKDTEIYPEEKLAICKHWQKSPHYNKEIDLTMQFDQKGKPVQDHGWAWCENEEFMKCQELKALWVKHNKNSENIITNEWDDEFETHKHIHKMFYQDIMEPELTKLALEIKFNLAQYKSRLMGDLAAAQLMQSKLIAILAAFVFAITNYFTAYVFTVVVGVNAAEQVD